MIYGVDLCKRAFPVGRAIEPAINELYLRVFEIAQIARLAHEAADGAAALDEAVDQMAPDKAGPSGHKGSSLLARLAHKNHCPLRSR